MTAIPVASADEGKLPERIGPYRILEKLGEGGMGLVYAAEQETPRRRVALKVLRASLVSDEVRRRFQYESAVLARLRHPCVAQIYDVGSLASESGEVLSFIAMELIEGGRPITDWVRDAGLAAKERLALFARVLDGIQHGHQRGVIHRDLKPGNLLVDAEGNPKIIDFGVARVTAADETIASLHTEFGQLLGTPHYMSPEQYAGDPADVDVRADVYASGVVLFELLSGRLPYDFEGRSILEVARMVRETPARRLSTLDGRYRGDLDTIVGTAMAKDRDRRYPSASAFAADVRRFLRREPIAARPPSALYQMRLFARRNKALVAGIAAVFLVSIAGAVVSSRFAVLAGRRADQAERQLYRGNMLAAGLALDAGQLQVAGQYLAAVRQDLRGWEWRHLESRLHQEERVLDEGGRVLGVAVAPDGRRIATRTDSEVVTLRDGVSGEAVRRFSVGEKGCRSLFFSRDGRRLFAEGNGADASWLLSWETDSGRSLPRIEIRGARSGGFALDRDGSRFAMIAGGALRLCETETGRILASRETEGELLPRSNLAFHPDGRWIAAAAPDDSLLLLDAATLEGVARLPGGGMGYATELAFSPDGSRLAAASEDPNVRIWNVAATPIAEPLVLEGHGGAVNGIAFDHRGTTLASVSSEHTTRIWDVATGRCRGTLRGHTDKVRSVAFFPDGERLVTASDDRTVRLWNLGVVEEPGVLRGHRSYVNPVAISPDGATLVSGGWDGLVGESGGLRWWDGRTGEPIGAWRPKAIVTNLALSPDGAYLAVGSGAEIRVLDATSGETVRSLRCADHPGTLSFCADGAHFAFEDDEGLHRMDLSGTDDPVSVPPGGRADLGLRPGPTEQWLVWEEPGFAPQGRGATALPLLHAFPKAGRLIAASPDGKRGAILYEGDRLSILRLEDGGTLGELRTPSPWCAAFSPDGERIAIGGADGNIGLWDARRFEEVAHLIGHKSYVFAILFSPDGERLISGSGDGTIRFWETRPVAALLEARRERRRILAEVEPRVLALFAGGLAPREVVARLRAEGAFPTPRHREVALQVALRESLARAPEAEPR